MEEKKLGVFDIFLIIVCGIMFADAIASNSSAGVPSITWWIICGLLYMIPSGLIIGELSGFLPGEGGIYVWIYEGMGPKWASFTSWLFFTCGIFIPVSSFIMISDIFFTLFFPAASFPIRVIVALALIWVLAFISTLPMVEAQWITNMAGIIKLVLFIGCGLAGALFIIKGNAAANPFTADTLMPTLDQGLEFLPIIVYCCTGMELASASANEMQNPAEQLPKIVIGCAALAVVLNVFANWGMLSILPADAIDLDLGLLDVFERGFGSHLIYTITGVLMLIGVFVQCAVWAVGGNRGTCEGAKAGDLPKFLAYEKNGQPAGAILTTTIIGSILLVLYAFFADSAADLFFSLLGCGVIGSLIPYVFMIIAYLNLRKTEKYQEYDGFKCPGGVTLAWIAQIIQCLTLFLMIYVPGVGFNSNLGTNLFGFAFMVVTGIIAIWWAGKENAGKKASAE